MTDEVPEGQHAAKTVPDENDATIGRVDDASKAVHRPVEREM
jgi:hypothetical protein